MYMFMTKIVTDMLLRSCKCVPQTKLYHAENPSPSNLFRIAYCSLLSEPEDRIAVLTATWDL